MLRAAEAERNQRHQDVLTMRRRALVIGGSGFVGGHLIPALLHDKFHVGVLNRGNKVTVGAEQFTANRTDAGQLEEIAQQVPGFDVIIDTSSCNAESTRTAWAAFCGPLVRGKHSTAPLSKAKK
ncbi:hypothetical protein A4R29_15280 [Mesorhizobium ciceri biovar biserrulae]|nr:hypothetical protein A4R29_15280 [Mesorhizobium ciceri biovar biserrulae]